MEHNTLIKKGVVVSIILLFVSVSVIPSTGTNIVEKTSFPSLNFNGFIQDLIDNASNGDTIYIPSGTYYENIIINKSISLIGEDKDTTIIDGNYSNSVVQITTNGVALNGFTIQNSGSGVSVYNYSGIKVLGDNNIISDNIIKSNYVGISLLETDYNNITDNVITSNKWGIIVFICKNIIIYKNLVSNNDDVGILTELPTLPRSSSYIKIIENDIINNHRGVETTSQYTTIIRNNFRNNSISALFYFWGFFNKWDRNYWNRPRLLPKPIFGSRGVIFTIPWIQFDWHPAQEPYDIGVG
ncbi:MAG: right-handed parallel beta-helix repeat-containing protein [Thermoplasmatales archaeon]|nr:MAG: right-handed parallel beta-helix repeat-containing protein [Thermoplasmatales archaeon]